MMLGLVVCFMLVALAFELVVQIQGFTCLCALAVKPLLNLCPQVAILYQFRHIGDPEVDVLQDIFKPDMDSAVFAEELNVQGVRQMIKLSCTDYMFEQHILADDTQKSGCAKFSAPYQFPGKILLKDPSQFVTQDNALFNQQPFSVFEYNPESKPWVHEVNTSFNISRTNKCHAVYWTWQIKMHTTNYTKRIIKCHLAFNVYGNFRMTLLSEQILL